MLRKTRCKHTGKQHYRDTRILGSNHGHGGGKAEGKWIFAPDKKIPMGGPGRSREVGRKLKKNAQIIYPKFKKAK